MGLFSLIFRLGVDKREFDRGMKQSVENVNHSTQQMAQSFGGLKHHIAGALAGAVSIEAIHQAIEFAHEISHLGKQLTVSTDTLQELNFVATQTGGTLEGFTNTFRFLAKARAKALGDPEGEEAEAFRRMGIGIEDLKKARLEDLLDLLSDKFKLLGDTQVAMADATKLLGRGARETFGAMVEGLKELREQAHEAGVIVSPETIERVAKYGNEWALFGLKLKRVGVEIAGAIANFHQTGAETFDRILDYAKLLKDLGLARISIQEFVEAHRQIQAIKERNEAGQIFGAGHVPGMGGFNVTQAARDEEMRREHARKEDMILEDKARTKLTEQTEILRKLMLSPEQLVADLEAKVSAKKRAFGFAVEEPNARDQLELTDLQIELERARKAIPKPKLEKEKNDALLSVGNFLGGAPDSRLANQLQTANDYLRSIESILQRQTNISFE